MSICMGSFACPSTFPSVLRHCWLGDKNLGVGLLVVTKCLELCTSYSSSCHHHHLHSSNKIQNGDILVPANPGPRGRWPLKLRSFAPQRIERKDWSTSKMCSISILPCQIWSLTGMTGNGMTEFWHIRVVSHGGVFQIWLISTWSMPANIENLIWIGPHLFELSCAHMNQQTNKPTRLQDHSSVVERNNSGITSQLENSTSKGKSFK